MWKAARAKARSSTCGCPRRAMPAGAMERRGFDIVSAADGKEGVELAASHAPDLILMDLHLPVMDGWEAARRLKAAPATKDIPILALTAHVMTGDQAKALQAGCDDYAPKPVELKRSWP